MKLIKFQTVGYAFEYNHETEQTEKKKIIVPAEIRCYTQAEYDANYPIAEKEAIPGTIEVSGEFEPEPETPETGDVVTWDEMDAAYQEGVDSV